MSNLRITIGQAFLPLLHFTDPFILIESPRGCLKTCSILQILMSRAAKWPGKRWYIWRSTRALLSTTVLPSFEEYVIPLWRNVPGMRLMNPNARPTQRSEYIFENGSIFTPVGLDDVLRGTSSEGAGGYCAEAVELATKDQVVALVGMMRQPGVPFHQIILDVNPGHPGHWTNQTCEAIDGTLRKVKTREEYDRLQAYNATPARDPINGKWKRIVAKIMDNPHYFDAETWQLRPAGESYMRGLGTLNGHLYARWVLGEWKAAEGGVYPEFSDKNICAPFAWPSDWPVIVGYDSGYDHPAAVIFYGVAPTGQHYILDEIHDSGIVLEDLGKRIINKARGRNVVKWLADPRDVFKKTAHASGKTIADYMRETFKLHFQPWPAASGQDVHNQVENVRNQIRHPTTPLQVFRSCEKTIQEFQSWRYKRMTDGSLPAGDDAYEDKNNDAMDAIKGIVATSPRYEHVEAIYRFGQDQQPEPVLSGPVMEGRKRWYGDEEE